MHTSVKWIRNILVFVLFLALLFLLILQTQFAKNLIRGKLEAYLTTKTGGVFRIAGINYRLPKWIEMNGVTILDKHGDTVLTGDTVRVDINLFKAIRGQYEIDKIALSNVNLNLTRKQGDSIFNYQFIFDAFAAKPVNGRKDTTPLVLSLHEIHIRNSNLRWTDPAGGYVMTSRLGKFDVTIDSLNIDKARYTLRNADMTDVFFDLHVTPTTIKNSGSTPYAFPYIRLNNSHLIRTHIVYRDDGSGISTNDVVADMKITNMSLQPSGSLWVDKAYVANSDLSYTLSPLKKVPLRQDTITGALINDSSGVLHIKELGSWHNTVKYDVLSFAHSPGFDGNHISMKDFNINAKNIDYTGHKINIQVLSGSGTDKSGLVIDSLRGTLTMVQDSSIYITGLLLQTLKSKIQGSAYLYPYGFTNSRYSRAQNKISFHNNVLSKGDLALFFPGLAHSFRKQLEGISTMYLNADADGNQNYAVIHRVTFRSDKNDVYFDAAGDIRNATSRSALRFNAKIYRLDITRNVMLGFLSPQVRKEVRLPSSMNIKGNVSGGMNELVNDVSVSSSYGLAMIRGRLTNFNTPKNLSYNLKLVAHNLETGKWIKQDSTFGRVNGTITAKGSGTDYKTASIQTTGNLSSFRIKKHNYTGIHFDIGGSRGAYDFNANTTDPLLSVAMRGKTDLNRRYPSLKSSFTIRNANLFALGLYPDTLSFRTRGNIDFSDLDPASLNAMIRLDSTEVSKDRTTFRLDSLLAIGNAMGGKTTISLNSSAANALVKGAYRYDELPLIFQQYLVKYMNTGKPVVTKPVSGYDMNIAIDVKPDPLYAILIPGLFFDKNMSLQGRISDNKSDTSRYLDLSVPMLVYQGNHVSALRAHAGETGDSLLFNAITDTLLVNGMQLYTTSLRGGLGNNRLNANLSTKDAAGRDRYAFSVTGNKLNDLFQFQLNDRLKLNYNEWVVNGKNNIILGKAGFNIDQLGISRGRESINLNSTGRELNAPVDVQVANFALHNITSLYNPDSLQVDGSLNASIRVADFGKNIPTLNGNVSIDSLQYQRIWLGNLNVQAKTINNTGVDLSGSLKGNGNNIDLKGTYDQSNINAQLSLNPIQFKTIESFSQGMLKRSSGSVTGPINITGNVKSPEWNGTLHFDSVYTQIAMLGTGLFITGQKLDLKYPKISFNQFAVRDSLGHELLVNGNLNLNKNTSFDADLALVTKDFHLLNNTAINNSQLYGTAIVDADIKITGPVMTPDVTGNVALKDQSNITFVRQQSIVSAKERASVMEFVDMDTVKNELIIPPASDWRTADNYTSINYNLNIDISKDAQFNIIVDPLTRDVLQLKGAGQLNAGVTPNGALSVTGAYNLSKGSYVMNYQFIRRKFELQEGSTLIFSGDPMNAEADITAIYAIEASPYDLIGNEVSDNSAIDSRLYKQKVPFEVLLKIKGRISEPTLQFDVRMKEGVAGISYNFSNTIDNKLLQLRSDAAGMNKQVFGLLVMGRFVGEQSTDFFGSLTGGNGLQAGQLVKASVSRFLSDAVNQVASDLIKGVDVNVNLQTAENYSNASQRTDLNLALSKRFMDDRLTVTVGKNFTVQGEDPSAKNGSAQTLPDITTTYKLSKDGRYMLKAYQRNQYEAVLDGYFVETGVAFTLSMDYNKFKEILHKNKMN